MTPKLILILGGARAGKSTFALRLAKEYAGEGSVAFIATAQALDDEMAQRIARHREERPAHWSTIEEPYQLDEALIKLSNSGVAIVDCLTLFISNWLLRDDEPMLQEVTNRFLATVRSRAQTVICVSNEVGLGLVPETPLGRTFRDLLGRVNQQFAEAADEVYLLVAGLPLRLKPRD
ncbi:MAG TPA: bifunctional adenosylcobinamide kinase/adenosylcobinamide-phosphate guanylyltransferase [Pyrinomonadaceae bacterium]|nr:bifunctional adenosylcobinamide kinase/adenosylcobinamide-phosphate guanylyltransferase [Pyrinomonadaceae bacterium]